MSDSHSGGGGDDLVAKQKEFLEAFFKKGAEFSEELLRENEKLRFRVVQLEEQLAASARALPTPATLKELVEKIHNLEQERGQLMQRFAHVEAENREYMTRYQEIERENNNLASLYVAAYQLHSTFEMREVLQIVVEILLNFVGAKSFAVLLLDDKTHTLRPVATEGLDRAEVPLRRLGEGIVGRVAESGEAHYAGMRAGARPGTAEPSICVPLRIQARIVGVLAIWDFLSQKTELADVDFEIFNLLGAHAASALEAARLVADAGEAGRFRFATAFEAL
jgi:nitrate/nitrite-specific signal transduction histidine kinase